MQEELIREYIRNGGEMWTLESINTYRDGGTKSLETNLKKPNSNHCISYYIHKNDWTLHYSYPTYTDEDKESMIVDKPTIAYIMDRINRYKENIEHKLKSTNLIIENLSIEGISDRKINEILNK
jgi:hypothetical protein